jgi:hypothetical protein
LGRSSAGVRVPALQNKRYLNFGAPDRPERKP